jgi:uncharacterized protein involved in exopolysaccharide biosynthesis
MRPARSEMLLRAIRPGALFASIRNQALFGLALAASPLFMMACVIMLTPPSYTAEALVFVDPREHRIFSEAVVLPGFGRDPVAVESLVEIARSDGFLQNVLRSSDTPGQELEQVKRRLKVARHGLTYLVTISFTSESPHQAASVANAIARGLIATDRQAHAAATQNAGAQIDARLPGQRDRMAAADAEIAGWKTRNHRVELQDQQTTEQLEIAALVRSLSAAQLEAGEAKHRLKQAERAEQAGSDVGMSSPLLGSLRERRSQLMRDLAQKQALFGERHPELTLSRELIRRVTAHIDVERVRILEALRSDWQATEAHWSRIAQQLQTAERRLAEASRKEIALKELERQAAAQNELYGRSLRRALSVREFDPLPSHQTRLVSPALTPARPRSTPYSLDVLSFVAAVLLISLACSFVREGYTRQPSGEIPPEGRALGTT